MDMHVPHVLKHIIVTSKAHGLHVIGGKLQFVHSNVLRYTLSGLSLGPYTSLFLWKTYRLYIASLP